MAERHAWKSSAQLEQQGADVMYTELEDVPGFPTTAKISALKGNLHSSDYLCMKWTEGELTDEEYADIKEKRQRWRQQINELEAELQQSEGGSSENT